MRSEFMLAFNEVCETHSLPKEIVIEALKNALVSAYRRDANVGNNQEVVAEVDQRTGELTIFAEKEVVESVFNWRTEVTLPVARRFNPEAELGDMVLVESTPEHFGRIAAQTAKQVILQRVREAEREQLYEDFSAREGEIVNGTVQSVTGQNITIGLGRTEAVLPKSQQVNGERYRAHDKIRVYVLEVRRTNRGPQIIVSRNHRNLLRRLLELEVPEIYNGQVDIKSIAREAGARSKVAVVALQPGIDPVGACVGMRGVRIQSIVRELNDEKIDVIEWDPDQKTFIAKALSPARVSQVFLEEHPDEGKTASVIVPDDQLSLAIGREGQNARLAAKLTGWRIDIKSLTEAASESLRQLDHDAVDPAVVKNKELLGQVELILAKKEANRPITSEDYMVLNRLVGGVEGKIVVARVAEYEHIQKLRAAARKNVPEAAWEIPTEELELSARVEGLLLENGLATVGSVILRLEMGEHHLLALEGFGDKALEEIQEKLALIDWPEEELEEEYEIAEAAETGVEGVEETAEPVVETEGAEEVAAEVASVAEVEMPAAEEAGPAEELTAELPINLEAVIDDLEKPLVELVEKPGEKVVEKKEKKRVVVVQPTTAAAEEEDDDEARRKQKGKQLVFDEQQGRVVVKRKRKGSRRRPEWENFEDMGVEDVLDEEF